MKAELDTTLEMTRLFDTTVEKLYEAWKDPLQMAQWMGPGEVRCENVQIDLQVGGKYRIHMASDKGDHIATSEYTEISPNESLHFTWGWQSESVTGTLVPFTFRSVAEGSELCLVHDKFPDRDAVEHHAQGWNGCLDGLKNYLA